MWGSGDEIGSFMWGRCQRRLSSRGQEGMFLFARFAFGSVGGLIGLILIFKSLIHSCLYYIVCFYLQQLLILLSYSISFASNVLSSAGPHLGTPPRPPHFSQSYSLQPDWPTPLVQTCQDTTHIHPLRLQLAIVLRILDNPTPMPLPHAQSEEGPHLHAVGPRSTLKRYQCTVPGCHRAYRRNEHLLRHMRSHDSQKPYECPRCHKCYSRQRVS